MRRHRQHGSSRWDRLWRDLAYFGTSMSGIPLRPLMADSQPSPAPPLTEDEILWRLELEGLGIFPDPATQWWPAVVADDDEDRDETVNGRRRGGSWWGRRAR